MTKIFNSTATTIPSSEGTLFTANSKSITLLIQAVNNSAATVNCEVWMTDSSNNHYALIFPSQGISAYNGISDNAKHVFPTGYKLRGTAGTSSTLYFEVSSLEGV